MCDLGITEDDPHKYIRSPLKTAFSYLKKGTQNFLQRVSWDATYNDVVTDDSCLTPFDLILQFRPINNLSVKQGRVFLG